MNLNLPYNKYYYYLNVKYLNSPYDIFIKYQIWVFESSQEQTTDILMLYTVTLINIIVFT